MGWMCGLALFHKNKLLATVLWNNSALFLFSDLLPSILNVFSVARLLTAWDFRYLLEIHQSCFHTIPHIKIYFSFIVKYKVMENIHGIYLSLTQPFQYLNLHTQSKSIDQMFLPLFCPYDLTLRYLHGTLLLVALLLLSYQPHMGRMG